MGFTEKEVLNRLRPLLSPERYRHTLSVARWAEELARRHGQDPARARRAGLLHDCAKEIPGFRLAALVRRRRLAVPDREFILRHGRLGLFHAYVSADRARREFGIKDQAVLSAIARHTLGDERMGPLDKILYVADFSAPQRGFAAAARLRRLARKDLDAAFRETVRLKILYVVHGGGALHPQTVRLWNKQVMSHE
jgi:predicted HD superfamily hydrolase involved in NAD metabolism